MATACRFDPGFINSSLGFIITNVTGIWLLVIVWFQHCDELHLNILKLPGMHSDFTAGRVFTKAGVLMAQVELGN